MQGEYGRVRIGRGDGYCVALSWGLATAAVLHFSGTWLAGLFSDVPEVVDFIATYLWIIPFSSGMVSVVLVAEETRNAIGKPVAASAQTAIYMICPLQPAVVRRLPPGRVRGPA